MIYEELSVKELQALTKDRGLGTGRSKGELINKLNKDDRAKNDRAGVKETKAVKKVSDTDKTPVTKEPEYREGPVTNQYALDSNPQDHIFEMVFERYPMAELDDTTHLDFRIRTFQAAIAAGFEPVGGLYGAYRIRSEGGNHTYGIPVVSRDDS